MREFSIRTSNKGLAYSVWRIVYEPYNKLWGQIFRPTPALSAVEWVYAGTFILFWLKAFDIVAGVFSAGLFQVHTAYIR